LQRLSHGGFNTPEGFPREQLGDPTADRFFSSNAARCRHPVVPDQDTRVVIDDHDANVERINEKSCEVLAVRHGIRWVGRWLFVQ
jgi:hypothetical protein